MSFTLMPVVGRDFVGREKLMDEMLFDLKDRNSTIGYALYGSRRIGKTSIFMEIKRKLEKERDIVCVYFSLWDMMSNRVSDFAREFSAEILDAYQSHLSLPHKAKSLLKAPLSIVKDSIRGLNLSVRLMEDIELLLTFDESRENCDKIIEDVFNLPEKLARETDTKCVILLDEFPAIMDLKTDGRKGEYIVRKIRTIHEAHKHITLCISGSIRSTMQMVALAPTSAFYRQFIIKEVKPLTAPHVKEVILRNLKGEVDEDVIKEIYEFSGGVPFYVQFIGRVLERRDKITKDTVKEAIDEFLEQEGNVLFKEEFSGLSPKERLILLAMAKENHSPSNIAKFTNDRISNVGRFLKYLDEKGYVSRKEKGYYIIDDPVFEKWLKIK